MTLLRQAAAAALAVAALVLTGCGAGHPAASASPAATHVAPSPSVLPGCQTALVVVSAVRAGIDNNSMTPESAVKQLDSAAQQTSGQVALDLSRAAYDLSQFNLRAAFGEPAGKWATRFAADLDRITRECQPG